MEKTKKPSAKINYIYNISYQLFAIIVPLITTPYISRVLGADGVGVYSYTYSIVNYFLIFAVLGTAVYGTKRIGTFQDNREERNKEFWETFILRIILTIIMIIIYYIYVVTFAENKFIAAIQGIYLLGTGLDISWFFQGIEDFKKITIRNLIIKVINVIYIFTFIKTADDLWKYILGLAVFTVLGNLIMWINIRRYVDFKKIKGLKPFKDFKQVLELFLPTIATQLFAIIDKTMIGAFSIDSKENGYYEQAYKIVTMSLIIITTLGTVLVPRIAKAFADKNIEEVKTYLKKSYKFVWLLGIPMLFGIIGVIDVFVPVFLGDGFDKVKIILPILSLLYIPMGMNYMTGRQYMIPTNQQDKYNKLLIIGGVINVVVNFILIPKYFAIGAAIGSVSGELFVLYLSMRYLIKTKQYSLKGFIKDIYIYCISGFIMFGVLLFMKRIIRYNLLGLLLLVIAGAIIYLVLLILLKEQIVMEQLNNIKNKLLNLKNKISKA